MTPFFYPFQPNKKTLCSNPSSWGSEAENPHHICTDQQSVSPPRAVKKKHFPGTCTWQSHLPTLLGAYADVRYLSSLAAPPERVASEQKLLWPRWTDPSCLIPRHQAHTLQLHLGYLGLPLPAHLAGAATGITKDEFLYKSSLPLSHSRVLHYCRLTQLRNPR